jgi:hypothetical protein
MGTLQKFLIYWAAFGTLAGGVVHIAALVAGPYWVEFLGAPPEIIQSARDGTWLAPVSTLAIAFLLFIWSAYAASVIGLIRKLPFLRLGNAAIAIILILRGLVGIPYFLMLDWQSDMQILFHGILSLYVLTMGIGYAAAFFAIREKEKAA